MRTFLELFAKSPFKPITRHARKVHDVAAQVRPLMDAFLAEDWDQTHELYEQISRLEHQADEIPVSSGSRLRARRSSACSS